MRSRQLRQIIVVCINQGSTLNRYGYGPLELSATSDVPMQNHRKSVDDAWTEPNCEKCQQLLQQIHNEFHQNHPPMSPKALALLRAKTHPLLGILHQRAQNSKPQP